MNIPMLSFDCLQVSPYQLKHIQDLKIVQKINDHARLTLTAIVDEAQKDFYVEMTTLETNVKLEYFYPANLLMPPESATGVLFQGVVAHIEIKAVMGTYYLYLEALSHTHMLDIVKRTRSFQDSSQKYGGLVSDIIESYEGANVIFNVGGNSPTPGFILQYEETDWEFMKRMASNLTVGLVPETRAASPKFFFGTSEGTKPETLEDAHYTIEKRIGKWTASATNSIPGWSQEETILSYRVRSEKLLQIGQKVIFRGQPLYVESIISSMQKSILTHEYNVTSKWALKQDHFYNFNIVGLSLRGSVIDVLREKIKIHLFVDKEQAVEKAYWFEYASMFTSNIDSGWHFMPEIGDRVHVYFPSEREHDSVAINSCSSGPYLVNPKWEKAPPFGLERDRWADPAIKSLKTKDGKEIIFAPDRIIIHSDGVYITLNDEDGVEIYTENNINIISKERISMEAEEIIINGKEKVTIAGGKTKITGSTIKIN